MVKKMAKVNYTHKNRQLLCICTYIDGKLNGECKQYNQKGELIEHSIWNNGEKIEVKTT